MQTKTMEWYKYHVLKYQQVNAEGEQRRKEEDAGNSMFTRNSCSTASSFISRWWLVWTWHVGGFSSSTVPVPSFPPRRTLIAVGVAIYTVHHKATALALDKALCSILAPL